MSCVGPDIDAGGCSDAVEAGEPFGCSGQEQAATATNIEHLFVTAPLVEREHPIAMMEFAELHVEEEEQPFEDQQRAGPEEHGSGQEIDLAQGEYGEVRRFR